jgi:urease accessory protein
MISPSELLTLLQHGDSFFPSGGFASSWGLETLHAEAAVKDTATLARFIEGQLRYRWTTCDRPALLHAHRAGDDLDRVAALDSELEALALARDMREASKRAGRALLRVHARLGTRNADAYLARLKTGEAYGHIPIVQGLVWRGIGLEEVSATILSGHLLCVAFVSAAVRLNVITHVEAQQLLQELRKTLAELVRLPALEHPHSFTPAADIAIMRHEVQAVRLFAN